ncbi:DUF3574 domain-containing protein [Methylobacterium radiodurans]|uniref:DUF3574 domain-containing protein n=1 Tax=Methylobacterium radiodurans TaxID=2202828 RepID=A0A2U8VRR8_9HYPH|nr:DUF3574 domain-containing protein [Methylobacterium radiodurans]AWN36424.1 DUF3574 domain-containing protein [Methylobacterium radiodurans]
MLSAQLLFGLVRSDGSRVTESAWRRFLARQITPLFPDGLTVLRGEGQWRRPDGRLLREPTRIVLVIAPETPATLSALETVRTAYRDAFAQEGVGLVLTRACARFR